MQPDQQDAGYLWDMLEAAKAVLHYVRGIGFEQYLGDDMMQAAVERKIEVMGEAARLVSDAFKKAHPEIPWRRIIAQRNVLAHRYGEIQQDRIWAVATIHVREIIARLQPLIPPEPPPVADDAVS